MSLLVFDHACDVGVQTLDGDRTCWHVEVGTVFETAAHDLADDWEPDREVLLTDGTLLVNVPRWAVHEESPETACV